MCFAGKSYHHVLIFLYKKSFSVVTQLHVQVHWFPINFNVNLKLQCEVSMPNMRLQMTKSKQKREKTYNFLLGSQDTQLAKANVKWGTLEWSIRLSHHDDIDAPSESGGVKAAVQLLHRHKHRLCQLAHNIHGLGLKTKQEVRTVSAVCSVIWSSILSFTEPLFYLQKTRYYIIISSHYSKQPVKINSSSVIETMLSEF